ncbi:MAG TPA: alpha/beta hydrolase [Anaeromyxobacter sp.]|nr:alpha/beta hydrolase [Anaeromyxobacter sp.]
MIPIVFLPGAVGRASFWTPVADRLRHLASPTLVGWPGFGEEPPDPRIGSLDDLLGWLRERLPPEPFHLVAQSMGGVLALRLALEDSKRVASLVLTATSGGVDLAGRGVADWRADFRAEHPLVPDWFERDRTDLTSRFCEVRVPTLILHGDADPLCPPALVALLERRIPGSRAIRVAGGTHSLARERPGEVAALIEAYLTSLAGSFGRATTPRP